MATVISLCNHKGGVAKTTSTVNAAYALSKWEKRRVLVIDADPQGNASMILGTVSPYDQPATLYDLLRDAKKNASDVIQPSKYKNLDLIACNIEVSALTNELGMNDPRRFIGLKSKLDQKALDSYDLVLIDCPPSLDTLFVVNALIVSDFYVVPIESDSNFALAGVSAILDMVDSLSRSAGTSIKFLGALMTMHDSRTVAAKVLSDSIKAFFGRDHVFKTAITRNTAVARANLAGVCVGDTEPTSTGAKTYRAFARELLEKVESYPR